MLTRRIFLQALSASALAAQSTQQKRNVLFIGADDLNNALGCYGHSIVRSPNIDKLAAGGVRFDRAYCQFPLCGPSRASLLTGLRPDTTKVLGNNIDFRDHLPDAVTLPQLFRNNGWFSAREGKMFHMNVPGEVGTPRFQDEPSWHHSVSPPGLENQSQGERREASKGSFGMTWISTATATGQADHNAADNALALLEKHREEPFFLGLGFLRPHLPFVAPSKFFDMYPLSRMELAKNPPDDLDDVPQAAKAIRPMLWNHMGMNEQAQREALRGYYASTSFMDEQTGRVLDALERMKLADNTIVVFWGDHGWNLGEHTRWQKMSLFEESARVPLIVRVPGAKANGRGCARLVEFVDLYPTLAELCGLRPPDQLEGQSFVPLLSDPNRKWKKAAFTQIEYENRIYGRSVRTERYRYMAWEGEGGGEELYDHRSDPREFRNLAQLPDGKTALNEMRRTLRDGWKAARA